MRVHIWRVCCVVCMCVERRSTSDKQYIWYGNDSKCEYFLIDASLEYACTRDTRNKCTQCKYPSTQQSRQKHSGFQSSSVLKSLQSYIHANTVLYSGDQVQSCSRMRSTPLHAIHNPSPLAIPGIEPMLHTSFPTTFRCSFEPSKRPLQHHRF